MRIVDAHTHWYPDFVSADPAGWARAAAEPHWGAVAGPRADGKRSLQGFPTIDKFLRDMDSAGVERAVIQGWYWENPANARLMNREVARAVAAHSDRLSAFASANPADSSWPEILREAADAGFCGIGELHSGVQGFRFASEAFSDFCGACAGEGLAVCLHLDDPRGKPYPNKVGTDNPGAFAAARANPMTKFIFAHWGGGEVFEPGFEPPENVFYDTAANTFLYGAGAWKNCSGRLADKMIYGSDYPLRLYPRKSRAEEMDGFAGEAMANVPSESAAGFFSGNFDRLMGGL